MSSIRSALNSLFSTVVAAPIRRATLSTAAVVTFIAPFLNGCTTISSDAVVDKPAIVSINGTDLKYQGAVSREANARAFLLASSSDEYPQRLMITSRGGEIGAGMELGEWIFDKRLDVYVPEYCVSSCANYVFPAGRRKFLNETAMLFWHGGALQEQWSDEPLCDTVQGLSRNAECDERKLQETIAELRVKEAAFFSKIEVDQQITVLGQFPEYECQGGYMGWYYSIQDMEKLGVSDIVVLGEAWNPTPPSPDIKICRVTLNR